MHGALVASASSLLLSAQNSLYAKAAHLGVVYSATLHSFKEKQVGEECLLARKDVEGATPSDKDSLQNFISDAAYLMRRESIMHYGRGRKKT